ncbi:hypothetical protein ACIBCN_33470 [Nocardia sp. NPDC051052]|uniref:hypothetical protein n=1 Tax=Nocardia sp. NPDC051052 TaxID=3364322 RepID=UPI0037B36CA9
MRIRTVVAGAVAALGLAVLGATAAGQAAAVSPEFAPEMGIYGILDLNHSETVALSNSPVPAMLDGLWMSNGLIDADPTSWLRGEDGSLEYGNISDVIAEAAETPGGIVAIGLVDPVRLYHGRVHPDDANRNLLVFQGLR